MFAEQKTMELSTGKEYKKNAAFVTRSMFNF